jgi:hypothetical protein
VVTAGVEMCGSVWPGAGKRAHGTALHLRGGCQRGSPAGVYCQKFKLFKKLFKNFLIKKN